MAWRVGVVVPARNEERLLERCLRSIEAALARSGVPSDRIHAVVVADACTDRTATLAARMVGRWGEVLASDAGNVGSARRAGVRRVLERFDTAPPERLWLANTDADSAVPPSWLAHQLELAELGRAAVAGVVEIDSFDEHPDVARARYEVLYGGGTDEHPHVHGANLGVRGDAYMAVGGWPPIGLAEDKALWRALVDGGWPTQSTRSLMVTTSGRRGGRASGGLASLLVGLGGGK